MLAYSTRVCHDGKEMEYAMTYVQTERAASMPLARSRPSSQKTVRQRRLERFAEILDRHDSLVRLLTRMEYAPASERPFLREDRSPLALAYQDEEFRNEGLKGDRLGDIMSFFQLKEHETHHLLCYCHYSGSVTSKMVAERARELAAKRTLGQRWDDFRARLSAVFA
jgi:hypothetical protein